MSFTGTVENGAIKLPEGVHLPDGTRVQIEPQITTTSSEFMAKRRFITRTRDFEFKPGIDLTKLGQLVDDL